ncbi:radical SAM protein [Peptoanaerobacter stomatis]
MNLFDLIDNYGGMINNFDKAEIIIKKFKEIIENKKIILYGGGCVGRVLYSLFNDLGVEIEVVFDKHYNDISVIEKSNFKLNNPIGLKKYSDKEKYLLIISTSDSIIEEVIEDIKKLDTVFDEFVNGHKLHIMLQSACCTMKVKNNQKINLKNCYECTILDNTCKPLDKYLKKENGYTDINDGITTDSFNMIGYILGSICSLNCKHCCECIPYIDNKNRDFVSKEVVIKDIEKLANICSFLTLIEFIGGEPFLNKDLPDIIKYVINMKRVGIIHIFTNGTVVPSDDLCKSIANDKITVYISNYQATLEKRKLDNIKKTVEKLNKYNISYFFGKKQNWFNFTSFKYMNESESYLKHKFSNCFLHNCNRLHKGVLYMCPHHYAGNILNIENFNNNVINIHEFDDHSLIKEIEKFKSYPYIEACKYCKMPYKVETVVSGEQTGILKV